MKIGDRVRTKKGETGVVTSIDDDTIWVDFDEIDNYGYKQDDTHCCPFDADTDIFSIVQ